MKTPNQPIQQAQAFRTFVLFVFLLFVMGMVTSAHAADVEQADQRAVSAWVSANSDKSVDDAQAKKIVKAAYKAAKQYKVDPLLLLAFMKPESNYKANAYNKYSKASGLMQVVPKWHRDKIGNRPVMNVDVNVEVGARIFSEYLTNHKGKMKRAIAQYSGGAQSAYHGKVADTYRTLKHTLVLDRFSRERTAATDHVYDKPQAYTDSLRGPPTITPIIGTPAPTDDAIGKFMAVVDVAFMRPAS